VHKGEGILASIGESTQSFHALRKFGMGWRFMQQCVIPRINHLYVIRLAKPAGILWIIEGIFCENLV